MNFCLAVRTSVGYMSLQEALQITHSVLECAPHCTIAPTLESAVGLLGSGTNCTSVLYINHVMVGTLDPTNLKSILQELKNARDMGMYHYEVSIYAHNQDILIETTRNRLLRPLIRAEFLTNGVFDHVFHTCLKTHVSLWATMEDRHIIEFYSPHEIEDNILPIVAAQDFEAYYARPSRYTHVEVDKLFMYSNTAANSTLQSHNACVRTSYACKHRSQAAAGRPLYSESAPENAKLELDYPQSPLLETVANRMTEHTMQSLPMTECVIGISNDLQSNEDGIIVSKSFLERGGMRITKTQEYHAQAKAHHSIQIPPRGTSGIKAANYSKLDPETGMVKKGTRVSFNDVLAGIVLEDTKSTVPTYSDKSIVYSKHVPGLVTKVECMETRYGVESYTITVQLVGVSQVQVGDKVASPYSQKSVVVAIVPQEDMPVVAYGPCAGMPLDLKYNCHGIPTRLTGATTDAPLYGIYAAKFGKRVNGTAYQIQNKESRDQFVHRMGGDGKVWMINPRTGTVYPEKMFVGIAPYMRVNHLVAEKSHARNGGPTDNYNQPKAGKANKGGSRMGKMEKMASEGHGASEFTYERMFVMSDRSIAYICERCSSINGEPPLKTQTRGMCRECNDPFSCRKVEIPYATIVFLNYMKAAGMPITFKLEPDSDSIIDIAQAEESDWTDSEEEEDW
jgi:DNA-directed RNA polymerase beta subunit